MFNTALILASIFASCVSISAFASVVVIPVGITSSITGIKICGIIASISKYKSIIKKKEKTWQKLSKLNKIEVLITKALTDSNISHDDKYSINNVLKEYDEI